MKKLYYLIIAAMLIVLTGCGELMDNDSAITHRPFKYDKADRWGMVGVDGTVLFENEFENEPSCVINGVFFVKNEKGMYEYYTAEAKPKRIGNKEYLAASYFIEDIAPVVEPEQHITFIKKDGSVAFKLDKFKDKDIVWTDNFSEGLAVFKTSDDLYGFVDTKGQIVVAPIYSGAYNFSDGLAVVNIGDSSSNKIFVINKSGKQQFEIKVGDDMIGCGCSEYCGEYLPLECISMSPNNNGNRSFIFNRKGEQVYRFKTDKEKIYSNVVDDKFLIDVNDKIGLQTIDGEILIRPKYKRRDASLFEDYIIVGDKDKFGVIDFEDNILVPFEYDEILPFNRSVAFVKDQGEWFLIDKKGERTNKKQVFAELGGVCDDGMNEIRSDYFDIDTYIKLATEPMTENSYDIIKLGSSAPDVIKKWASIKLENYTRNNDWRLKIDGPSFLERIIIPQYDDYVVKPIVEMEQYGYYDCDYRDVIKGYQPNPNAKVRQIQVELNLTQSISNKNQRLREALENWAKSNGYQYTHNVNWDNQNWDVYKNANGYLFVILRTDNEYSPMRIIISK